MPVFYRGVYSEIELKLAADEPLGVLDAQYLEDYNGNDGQISLYHVQSGQRFPVLMSPVPGETPGVDNDVFVGYMPLALLPDGRYKLQFRARDLWGHYTVVGGYHSPSGDERQLDLELVILSGFGLAFVAPGDPVRVVGSATAAHRLTSRKSDPLTPLTLSKPPAPRLGLAQRGVSL